MVLSANVRDEPDLTQEEQKEMILSPVIMLIKVAWLERLG
jgi:hypothetical protein